MLLKEISQGTSNVKWRRTRTGRSKVLHVLPVPSYWPISEVLNELINCNPRVGNHVKGVLASVNELIEGSFEPSESEADPKANSESRKLLRRICDFCFTVGLDNGLIENEQEREFSVALLRAAALYHDVGKTISSDHHVSRGVHLMRDVSEDYRRSVENGLFSTFKERRDFWALLRHHDIYGCLCTGEASLPALFDMVSWSGSERKEPTPLNKRPVAYLSYLALLNIADSDSSLLFNPNTQLKGITTVEVCRYLTDWGKIKGYLWEEYVKDGDFIKREQFKNWSLAVASHPEEAIRRITRLVASCYRAEMSGDEVPEAYISRLVEDELQSLHGARIEQFCYLFARFCKMDYGLRFFYILMRHALMDPEHRLKRWKRVGARKSPKSRENHFPELDDLEPLRLRSAERKRRREDCLRKVVNRTCLILSRMVEDYGHLVAADQRSSPLLCVVMAGLMTPVSTGWAICRSLKDAPSRALRWISDEIGVRLYGE